MKRLISVIFIISTYFYIFPQEIFAQIGCGVGFGPIADAICRARTVTDVGDRLNKVISFLIGFLTIVAALWFMIQFILAGIQWIGAGGDKQAVEAARSKIFNALIGLIIVVAAWVIVGVLAAITGIQILNPGVVLRYLSL